MNSYWARLNSMERRFVVVVGLVFFIVINLVWVIPHFSDWSNLKNKLASSQRKLTLYKTAIDQIPSVRDQIKKLANEGQDIPPEDQSIQFLRTIQTETAKHGVQFFGNSRQSTSTNQFFIEQSQTITAVAGEKELVDFLYDLGSGNSLIRVRALALRPDQTHQKLSASITLIASYQKNPNKQPAAPATRPAAAAPKPGPAAPGPTPGARPADPKTAKPVKS